jgi:transcriptional regulator with XRE-family HTH domain
MDEKVSAADEQRSDEPRPLLERFGVFVRDTRRALGLTQADLAAKVGVSRTWVTQVEGGELAPSFEAYIATIHALDMGHRLDPTATQAPSFLATTEALGLTQWIRELSAEERAAALVAAYEKVETMRALPSHPFRRAWRIKQYIKEHCTRDVD